MSVSYYFQQINYVAIDGFNFTAKVMLRDLNSKLEYCISSRVE